MSESAVMEELNSEFVKMSDLNESTGEGDMPFLEEKHAEPDQQDSEWGLKRRKRDTDGGSTPTESDTDELSSFYDLRSVLFSSDVDVAFFSARKELCGIVGMVNLGNTCYLNAAVQALSHCPPLRNFFCVLEGGSKLKVVKSPSDVSVSLAFKDLLKRLWTANNSLSTRPTVLVYRVREKCAQFRGYGQQDAQEFIRCFLDVIHQELKYEVPTLPDSPVVQSVSASSSCHEEEMDQGDSGLSTENESTASSDQNPQKKDTKPSSESVVNVVFDGSLISSVRCLTCHHLSETKETFQDISLSIPTVEQLEKMRDALDDMDSTKTSNDEQVGYTWWLYDITARWLIYPWFSWIGNFYRYWFAEATTLDDCLRGFFAQDHLRGEDMYKCEKCNKLRNGVKQCRIQRQPEVLCVHLKRFRHDSLYNSKVNTKVLFPLTNLDLTPYLADADSSEQFAYDLLSVVSHRGIGHYVAYCLNDQDQLWYEFDDSYVRTVSESEVLNSEAYVLFYRKRSANLEETVDTAES